MIDYFKFNDYKGLCGKIACLEKKGGACLCSKSEDFCINTWQESAGILFSKIEKIVSIKKEECREYS